MMEEDQCKAENGYGVDEQQPSALFASSGSGVCGDGRGKASERLRELNLSRLGCGAVAANQRLPDSSTLRGAHSFRMPPAG